MCMAGSQRSEPRSIDTWKVFVENLANRTNKRASKTRLQSPYHRECSRTLPRSGSDRESHALSATAASGAMGHGTCPRVRRVSVLACAVPTASAQSSTAADKARSVRDDRHMQLTQFGAGALAGLVNTLVLSPLDVVKTRLQVQGMGVTANPVRYRGIFHALRVMGREEGFGAYYRGLSASVWAFVPNWAIYWYTYEAFKRRLVERSKAPAPLLHIASALGAGAITAVTTAPFWTLKSRLQTDMAPGVARRYRSVPHGFRKIIAEEGVSGLYKGLTPTMLGLGHVAVQFPLYEYLKSTLSGGRHEDVRASHVLIASSLSKIAASAMFYPHEVLRTRIQVDRTVARHLTEPARVARLIREILRADGAKGLYRGFGANLIRSVPSCAFTFTSYELVKRFAERHHARREEELLAAKDNEPDGEGAEVATSKR